MSKRVYIVKLQMSKRQYLIKLLSLFILFLVPVSTALAVYFILREEYLLAFLELLLAYYYLNLAFTDNR